MPTDAFGTYALPDGYEATTGETIEANQHNTPLEDIEAGLTQRLMASGVKPMSGPLLLADGTEALPAAAFNSANSRGWYKTTDGIGISIGGTKVVEITSGGIKIGARFIGELIPMSRLNAPALCVAPVGQALSRAGYPDLWVVAQAEIAGGNTFYNSGNGSTTFGIGDVRGRVFAALDNMAGTATANRLSSILSSSVLGAVGGVQSHILTTSELAAHQHTASGWSSGNQSASHNHFIQFLERGVTGGGDFAVLTGGTGFQDTTDDQNQNHIHGGIGGTTDSTGSSAAHTNVQPTMMVAYALFAGA